MALIYPALFGLTDQEIQKIELVRPFCSRMHIDIMDNIFVPNKTSGSDRICEVAKNYDIHVWLHCMVQDPLHFLDVLCIPQGSLVSFHIESSSDFFLTIKKIIEKKCLAGIAINPKTALHEIIPLINNLDHIVIMSVNPGFSGQPFLEEVIPKIDELIAYKYMHGYTFKIGIDGGVNASIISLLAHKDIDYYAISSAIFQQADPYAELKRLTALVRGSKR